jgi:copper(I)-binding protein
MQATWGRVLVVAGLAFAASPLEAHVYTLKNLTIDHPSARATPPGSRTGGAYFTVENSGRDNDRLVGVSSPAAANAEMHTMTMDGNVMRMRATRALDVPAGGKLTLSPGGFHVMLLDLKQPLVAGDNVPLRLTFEKAGTIDVSVEVEAVGDTHPHK